MRRGKNMGGISIGAAKALIWVLRMVFRLEEYTAPPERQQKLRALREKMDDIEQGHAVVQRRIREDPRRSFEISSAYLERFDDDETKQSMAEGRQKIKAIEEEGNTLQEIRTRNKDTPEKMVTEFQRYVEVHPDSRIAFSYLGGVLEEIEDWDASISAYQEAERLAAQDGLSGFSGMSARLQIGQVLHHKGDFSAAVTQYQGVIADAKREGAAYAEIAYLYLGNTLNAQGNRREARSAWKRATKNKTLAPEARKLLEANP